MTDLGIYNFIKSSLAQGKSKDEIINLLSTRMSREEAEKIFVDVQQNPPSVPSAPNVPDFQATANQDTDENKKLKKPVYVPIKEPESKSGIYMIIGIVLIGIAAYMIFGKGVGSSSSPSVTVASSLLQSYLTDPVAQRCAGQMTLESLSNVRVGDYYKNFGGWPVYADYVKTCTKNESFGPMKTTTKGNSSDEAAIAFIRKNSSGGFEMFLPDVFKNAFVDIQF